ncbi:MAG: Gfo/Idh/MocA family oxidoreductase [Bacteroidales bacterium]|jgi:predicted dehydrogenase
MKKESTIFSRRDFVRKSVNGMIGVAVMPTILTSCSNWKGANDRVAVAHIGVGSRGTDELMSYFLQVKDAMNIAVADTFQSRRENAAAVINKYYKDNNLAMAECKAYLDFREILERKDIDAVHITTPDHWHIPAAILAARAGKHIMLAKPLGLSYPGFMTLKSEVAKNGVHFHYGTQQRTSPHMKLAHDIIHDGLIGEIERADVWAPGGGGGQNPICNEVPVPDGFDYDRWSGPAALLPYCPERVTNVGSWYTNDYSIGFLAGWGAHPLDILVWMAKDKVKGQYSCEGTGLFWSGGLYNNIMSWDLTCKYQNGFELHFVSEDKAATGVLKSGEKKDGDGTTFFGTKGWISVSRSSASSDIPEIHQKLNDYPKSGKYISSEPNTMGQVFVDVAHGKIKELCPLDEAIISDTISHMGDIAIRSGRKVTWDPTKGEILGDPEANTLFIRQPRIPYTI